MTEDAVYRFLAILACLVALYGLSGCDDSPPSPAIESAKSLLANPERHRELRALCRADRAEIGDAQCNEVAEATRQRFFGSGGPQYTPPASAPGGFWQDEPASPVGRSVPAAKE